MHPVENLRGAASSHLAGRRIVLGVCGSIAAVKAVELARELVRHGADVVPVMTESATRILHPDALEFATGHRPVTRLSGAVEHVALLGDVPGKADLLLVAPATANTVAKMALGIDDTPVTTCATVAFGTATPVVVAPAMHEAMLRHPVVAAHADALVKRLGATWVGPLLEERKAKLADVEAIAEAVIHRLANDPRRPGPLAGRRALVVSGSTAEPLDAVRVVANRSSGRSGHLLATELRRLGAEVTLWEGHATEPVPEALAPFTVRFGTHAELMALVRKSRLAGFHQVWMPAAVADYAPVPAKGKVGSGRASWTVAMKPLPKAIAEIRRRAPKAVLVAFKAEADARRLVPAARRRLQEHRAQFVVANTAAAFGAAETSAILVDAKGERRFDGPKERVMAGIARHVATGGAP